MKKTGISFLIAVTSIFIINNKTMAQSFDFPDLPYAYNALEPYIDAQTMEIHYSKHYKTYYTNFLKAVEDNNLGGKSIEDIFSKISSYPAAVRNNGGGYFNHRLF